MGYRFCATITSVFLLALLVAPRLGAQALITRNISGHAVDVRAPRGAVTADVLVLPGWNFDKAAWGKHTALYAVADSLGWRLVMPQMLRSIYASRFYPETQAAYRSAPSLSWISDSLLPQLQLLGIFLPTRANYLIGLSTGARGVARVAWVTDTLFAAGVALSGDYAHTDTTDKLLIQSYGSYSAHRARWAMDEPLRAVGAMRVPLYLAHAGDDRIVPQAQTVAYAYELMQAQAERLPNGRRSMLMLQPSGGHTWAYWNAELLRAVPWLLRHRR